MNYCYLHHTPLRFLPSRFAKLNNNFQDLPNSPIIFTHKDISIAYGFGQPVWLIGHDSHDGKSFDQPCYIQTAVQSKCNQCELIG